MKRIKTDGDDNDEHVPRIILFGARDDDTSKLVVYRIHYLQKEDCLKLFQFVHEEQEKYEKDEKDDEGELIELLLTDAIFDLLLCESCDNDKEDDDPSYHSNPLTSKDKEKEREKEKKENIKLIKRRTGVDILNKTTQETIYRLEATTMKEVRKLGKVFIEQLYYTGQYTDF